MKLNKSNFWIFVRLCVLSSKRINSLPKVTSSSATEATDNPSILQDLNCMGQYNEYSYFVEKEMQKELLKFSLLSWPLQF